MIRNSLGSRAILLCVSLAMMSITAVAQEKRIEISGSLGYGISSGIDINPTVINTSVIVGRVRPKSGFSFGLQGDYNFTEHFAAGFHFHRLSSKLLAQPADGSREQEITDMPVYNYHGVLTYNFGKSEAKIRPFVFGGLGATHYSPGSTTISSPGTITILNFNGRTKLSYNIGGGVKIFLSKLVGFKLTARWTPTNISPNTDGFLCSPGTVGRCLVVVKGMWSSQGEFGGGIIFRF